MIKPTLADYLRELSDHLTVMLRDLVLWADEYGLSGGVWDRANKLLSEVEGEGWKEVRDENSRSDCEGLRTTD